MSVVMPGKFADRARRPLKRHLSTFEKSSVINPHGRALVMPAEPNTEIEELVDIGFNPCFIYGVEQDVTKSVRLESHYHDQAHIHNMDIFQFMSKVRGIRRYSYLHIDLCGMFSRDVATKLQNWRTLPGPDARLRVTAFRARQSLEQQAFEIDMQKGLLLRWCELGYELDTVDPERWINYYEDTAKRIQDTTWLVIALAVTNFFFGIDDYRTYFDDCSVNGSYLPVVDGDYLPTNINRWKYAEPGTPNHMFTVWMDLQPLEEDRLNNSTQWILNQLATVFEQLDHVTPTFEPNQVA